MLIRTRKTLWPGGGSHTLIVDTNVLLSADDVNRMILTMNKELDKLKIWLSVNNLSLNIDKTHHMTFGPKSQNYREITHGW